MRFIAHHFVSGDVFFSGTAFLCAALLLSNLTASRRRLKTIRLTAIFGILLIAASAIPLPGWYYALWGLLLLAWLLVDVRTSERPGRIPLTLRLAAATITLLALVWEIGWRAGQQVEPASHSTLYIIGDSLSAGMYGPDEPTWPRQLRRRQRIDVVDLSQAGEKTAGAIRQAEAVEADDSVVLIEIGGNDLLGETSASQFATDLDALLTRLSKPGRQLVMLELPLPPSYNGYGRAQRMLSRKHGVVLIPRRQLADVIFAADATSDGLHLTETGHRLMAEMIWRNLSQAFEAP